MATGAPAPGETSKDEFLHVLFLFFRMCYRITVERAKGIPRGSDQWRYGDSRGGYGDSRRSA